MRQVVLDTGAASSDIAPAVNVSILVLAVVSLVVGILLLVLGRRRRLTRAATTGVARTSALEILGIALAVAGLGSFARAF